MHYEIDYVRVYQNQPLIWTEENSCKPELLR